MSSYSAIQLVLELWLLEMVSIYAESSGILFKIVYIGCNYPLLAFGILFKYDLSVVVYTLTEHKRNSVGLYILLNFYYLIWQMQPSY